MKKIFTNLTLIIFIPALYFIFVSAISESGKNINGNKTVLQPPPVEPKDFVNIIMNCDYINCQGIWVGDHLYKYKELGYNSVHVYPMDNPYYGIFNQPYDPYQIEHNTTLINAVHNAPLKFFYEQVKLSVPCYAQKIEYSLPSANGLHDANNGFCFQNVMNNNLLMNDGNKWVIHPVAGVNSEGYLCRNIYENLQQSDFFGRQVDYDWWYLYPTAKIKQEDYQNNPTAPVFAICIRNFKGEKSPEVDSLIFYAYDFGQYGGYNGNYIELHIRQDNLLNRITGTKTNNTGLNLGVDDENYMPGYGLAERCKVDFQIYWYGQVDFWFEKLTTLDDDGEKLFYKTDYDGYIDDELINIGSQANLYSYSMDEVTYSQLPAIKHVMDKISEYNTLHSTNIKFLVSESNWMAHNKMRKTDWGHQLTLQYLQPRAINVFAYEFAEYNWANVYYPPCTQRQQKPY